jgi:hypothetical protein
MRRTKPSEAGPTAAILDAGTGGLHERPGSVGSWPALLETSGHTLNAGTVDARNGEAPFGCS